MPIRAASARPAERWRSRIVGTAEVAPETLLPNPANWRRHPAAQARALEGALDEVGWVVQVVVNRTTGHLVDGHLRVERAKARREPSVPVLYVELSEDEERLVLATLDPLGAMASADAAQLETLLASLRPADEALAAMLAELAAQHGLPGPRHGDPDDLPPLPEPAALYVRRGERWRLGRHVLLVGDAASADDLARLLGGRAVDLLWCDPPFGVAYGAKLEAAEARARHRRRDGGAIANDDADAVALRQLLDAAFANAAAAMRSGAPYYVACPDGISASGDVHVAFRLALAGAGLPVRQALVWVKDRFVLGRNDYHWRHEALLYGWKPGARHYFTPERHWDTVFEIARPARSPEHPTVKPVELIARCLANSSLPGDVVLDPFAGAGSTVIAAEQLERHAFALELDPRYAQVTLERWQRFSGEAGGARWLGEPKVAGPTGDRGSSRRCARPAPPSRSRSARCWRA